jgi:uncharacterized protein YndB with AHSA1/START domain
MTKLNKNPAVTAEMLIRRPVSEVFEAFIDPEITTKFWFTKSSGKLEEGRHIRWDWEMYGVHDDVYVQHIEVNRRIVIESSGSRHGAIMRPLLPLPTPDLQAVRMKWCRELLIPWEGTPWCSAASKRCWSLTSN